VGATGGVGAIAVQLFKTRGAYVIATPSTDAEEGFVRGLTVYRVVMRRELRPPRPWPSDLLVRAPVRRKWAHTTVDLLPPSTDRNERSREDPGSLLGGVETGKRSCPALNVGIAGEPLSHHFSSRRPRGRPHPPWYPENWSPAREALDANANVPEQVTEAHADRKVVAPGLLEPRWPFPSSRG
jgi:hypothetical protein